MSIWKVVPSVIQKLSTLGNGLDQLSLLAAPENEAYYYVYEHELKQVFEYFVWKIDAHGVVYDCYDPGLIWFEFKES